MTQIYAKQHREATSVHKAGYFQSTDPGPVGAGRFWIVQDGSPPYALKIRNSDNTAWEVVTEADISAILQGHKIMKGATVYTQRQFLRFAGPGVTVTDDAVNDTTIITISGGGGDASEFDITFMGESVTYMGETIRIGG